MVESEGNGGCVIMMRIFLAGLALNFDADFHELEEIMKRALLEIQTEA